MAIRKMNEDSDGKPTIGMKKISKQNFPDYQPKKSIKRKSLGQKISDVLGPPNRDSYDFVKNPNPLGPPTKAVKKKRY